MFKQTQPFQSAYFNYFDTTGDNLNTSNYTYWYKTNLFSWEILTICNNLNFSNHNFLTNPTFSVGRFQLFHTNGDTLNSSKHHVDTKPTIPGRKILLYSTIWTRHIIHDDTKLTFSVGRFQLFSTIWTL